jgi:hypothetical protein
MPVVSHVFGTGDALLKLRYIEEDPAAWDLAMAMLGVGGLIAAIGLVPLARSVQQVTDRRILGVTAYGAATLAIGGAVSWVIISYIRIVWSPFEVVLVEDHRPADALLIRPDAHIAWAAAIDEPTDTAAPTLREALSGWFGTP